MIWKTIAIDNAFSKWFVDWKGKNKVPSSFASYLRNARVQNSSIQVRKWHRKIYNLNNIISSWTITLTGSLWNTSIALNRKINFKDWDKIYVWNQVFTVYWNQFNTTINITTTLSSNISATSFYIEKLIDLEPNNWVIWNNNDNKLYTTIWANLYEVNTTDNTLTILGGLPTSQKNNFITYWVYTLIFTSNSNPYVYNSSNWQLIEATTAPASLNPVFWSVFAWFTCIVWSINKNILYISRPIDLSNQNYCYDWTWTWSQQITLKGNIIWLTSTLDNLYIFTKDKIEVITKQNLWTTWNIQYLYTTPLGKSENLPSHKAVVSAWDKIFFYTWTSIKTIWFTPWIIDAQIWDLSERPLLSIRTFLDNLNKDQSKCFWFYNKVEKTINWHVRSNNSLVNDTVIVYDVINDNWYIDNNKYFWDITEVNDNYYSWSWLNNYVFQDYYWNDDDWEWIPFEYHSTQLNFWNPNTKKFFRWFEISWEMNYLTKLSLEFIVDWQTVNSLNITLNKQWEDWIWSKAIWWEALWWDIWKSEPIYPFTKVLDKWQLRIKWKEIWVIIKWNNLWQDFYLDYMWFIILPAWNTYETWDKL